MARHPHTARQSLIERRQHRVRRELVNAAMQLFFEQGYEATTVEEIVDAVEISASTFYRHFPTKSDVVLEFSRLQLEVLGEAVAARPINEPLTESLCAAVKESAADLGTDLASLRHFEELIASNTDLRGRLLAEHYDDLPLIAASLAPRLGLRETDLRTEILGMTIASTIRVAFARWGRSDGSESPAHALEAALLVLQPLLDDH